MLTFCIYRQTRNRRVSCTILVSAAGFFYSMTFLRTVCHSSRTETLAHDYKERKMRRSWKPLRLREKFAVFIPFRSCFFFQKDLKLMKKSQEGNQNGNVILQRYNIINAGLTIQGKDRHVLNSEEEQENYLKCVTISEFGFGSMYL